MRPTKSCYHPFTSNYRYVEELRESYGQELRQLSDTCMKHSTDSAKQRVKREFCGSSDSRIESTSKMTGSTTHMFDILRPT